MQFVQDIYCVTKEFPRDEIYGLTSQIRRAAVSVPSNIAEGQGRRSRNEFIQFLRVSRGSLMEVETQLLIAAGLNYLSSNKSSLLLDRADEIGKMLDGLMSSIRE